MSREAEVSWGMASRSAAAVAALLVAGMAVAQTTALAPKSVREFVDADERISGNAIVGLAYVGAGDVLDPGQVHAFIESPPSGDLSVEFNGIDGRYAIKADYGAAGVQPSATPLALQFGELQHRDRLKGYTAETAAVLLKDSSGRRYPVRWNGAGPADNVRVYLNTERAEAFFFAETPQGRQMTLCRTPLSVTPPFKFNRFCDIPAAQLDAGPVQIQRRFGSRRLDPITLDIARRRAP